MNRPLPGLHLIASWIVGFGVLTCLGAGNGPITDWQARVAPQLLGVWKAAQVSSAAAGQSSNSTATVPATSTHGTRYDSHGRLQIDVWFDCAGSEPSAQLVAAGMVISTTVRAAPMCVVEGWVNVSSIPELASLAGIKMIELPHYRVPKKHIQRQPKPSASVTSAVGPNTIDGNGLTIMAVDQFTNNTGINGAGVTLGVISDDVQNITVIQWRGELPAVNLVQPSANPTPHSTFTDEGTMMLEEVHAVAPGATLAFCGPDNYVEYVGCLTNLITAGATVVSDDLSYAEFDTMSSQNSATQAVQNLLASNPEVMLFTAAGNNRQNYWQGRYTADNSSGSSFVCNGQTDTYFENFGTTILNTWSLSDTSSGGLILAWADPFGANISNFDLYVFDAATSAQVGCAPGAGSTVTFDAFLPGAIGAPGSYYLVIGTPDASLNGKFLKLMGFGDGAESFSINASGAPSSPQDFATGVFTVGAVNGSDGLGNTIEPFSNTGPIQLELPAPSMLQAPIVAAPDGVLVDAVGTNFQTNNGLFYGTSAASPNTAAVAALLRSAFPTLTPTTTIAAIEAGAISIAAYGAVPNGTIGYGRVNAIGALAAVPAPRVSAISAQSVVGGTSSPALLFGIGGTGALTLTTNSDNSLLVANSGITVGPSTCSASTVACTVTITPVLGQVGTADVIVTVTDSAKRTASTKFAVTVTKPPPPTLNVTAGASQTIPEGGVLTPATFTVTGTEPLTVIASSGNMILLPGSGVTLSAGCGGPGALTCSANFAVASGQAGIATVTFTVTDPYGQSRSAAANVTVNSPPATMSNSSGGGGGSIDVFGLLSLAGLLVLRRARDWCARPHQLILRR